MDGSSAERRRGDPEEVRRILLVGFMGSGKTTVGRELARRIGWDFVDFDDVIEARTGRSIPEIFAAEGEAGFRRIEASVARDLLELEGAVLASGGGWPAAPGRMDAAGAGTISIWLRVPAEVAVARARSGSGPDSVERPLLETDDPLATARELLRRREPYYRKADHAVDGVEGPPREVVRRILRELASRGIELSERAERGS